MRDDDAVRYVDKTPDQKRQYHKKRAAESRQRKRDADTITEGAACETRAEWWALCRSKMTEAELQAALGLHEECMSYVRWLQFGAPFTPEPDLSMQDMVDDLVQFVREHPCPRLGSLTAGDLPPDWGEYWKDAVMLKRIEAEGPATYLYARTGLLSGLPDHYVWRFLLDEHVYGGPPLNPLGKKAWNPQDALHLVGMVTTKIGDWTETRYK
jgi:hypothetical protein